MTPLVVGRAPYEIEAITADVYRRGKWHNARAFANQAFTGIEIALWDLVGKLCDQPLVNLFGGAVREEVDFFFYLQQGSIEQMVAEASRAVHDGYHVIYVKIGTDDDRDVETVRSLREALGPGPKLRVDANEAWAPGAAVAMICRLVPFGIDFVEQPVGSRDLDGLARVRAASPIPIAANQSAFTHFDVLEVIKRQAADLIVTGPHQAGGLLQLKKIAAMAESAGLPINRHAVGELGVGALAGLQVIASLPNLTDGNQTHHRLLADDVLAEPLQFSGGRLSLPPGPGIGVTLDDDKVERYASLYDREEQFYNFPTHGE